MAELVVMALVLEEGGLKDTAGLVAVVEFLVMAAVVVAVVVIQVVAAVVLMVVVVVVVHTA
jgi:hypothetical protein